MPPVLRPLFRDRKRFDIARHTPYFSSLQFIQQPVPVFRLAHPRVLEDNFPYTEFPLLRSILDPKRFFRKVPYRDLLEHSPGVRSAFEKGARDQSANTDGPRQVPLQ